MTSPDLCWPCLRSICYGQPDLYWPCYHGICPGQLDLDLIWPLLTYVASFICSDQLDLDLTYTDFASTVSALINLILTSPFTISPDLDCTYLASAVSAPVNLPWTACWDRITTVSRLIVNNIITMLILHIIQDIKTSPNDITKHVIEYVRMSEHKPGMRSVI